MSCLPAIVNDFRAFEQAIRGPRFLPGWRSAICGSHIRQKLSNGTMSCAEPPPCRQRPNEEASCSTFDRRRHGGRRHSFGFPGSLVSARMRPKSVGVCMCSKLAGGNNLTYVGFGLPWGCSLHGKPSSTCLDAARDMSMVPWQVDGAWCRLTAIRRARTHAGCGPPHANGARAH